MGPGQRAPDAAGRVGGGQRAAIVPRAAPRDDVVLQFFTSGTTGTPKCVGIGRGQLISAVQGVARRLSLTPADTSLSTAPLTHTLGMITTILVPLVSGGAVAFADPKQPREFVAALARSRPTWCAASPAGHQLVYRLMSGAGAEWPGLRFLRASAAPLAADVARQLEDHYSAPVISAYVMTEAPGEIASQAPDRDRRAGTVGKPTLCDVEIRSEGELLPAGRSGEIWIRGPNVVSAGHAWVPTKDIGWLDDEGFLRVTGRVDDIINSGGLKIWPPDVEMAARADPAVATAVAFPVPHPGMGETVGLVVVPVPGRTVDRAALRRRLMAALPRSAWPGTIVVCAEIPRSARGKISRRALWRQLPGVRARIRP